MTASTPDVDTDTDNGSSSKSNSTTITIGSVSGAAVLLLIVAIVLGVLLFRKRRNSKNTEANKNRQTLKKSHDATKGNTNDYKENTNFDKGDDIREDTNEYAEIDEFSGKPKLGRTNDYELDQKHYSRLTEHRSDEHPYTKASSNLGEKPGYDNAPVEGHYNSLAKSRKEEHLYLGARM